METKVKPQNIRKVASGLQGWHYYSNTQPPAKDRIWVIWKPNKYTIKIEKTTEQLVHCSIVQLSSQKYFYITYVYGFNKEEQRSPLWHHLKEISQQMTEAWLVIGDFNAVLHL